MRELVRNDGPQLFAAPLRPLGGQDRHGPADAAYRRRGNLGTRDQSDRGRCVQTPRRARGVRPRDGPRPADQAPDPPPRQQRAQQQKHRDARGQQPAETPPAGPIDAGGGNGSRNVRIRPEQRPGDGNRCLQDRIREKFRHQAGDAQRRQQKHPQQSRRPRAVLHCRPPRTRDAKNQPDAQNERGRPHGGRKKQIEDRLPEIEHAACNHDFPLSALRDAAMRLANLSSSLPSTTPPSTMPMRSCSIEPLQNLSTILPTAPRGRAPARIDRAVAVRAALHAVGQVTLAFQTPQNRPRGGLFHGMPLRQSRAHVLCGGRAGGPDEAHHKLFQCAEVVPGVTFHNVTKCNIKTARLSSCFSENSKKTAAPGEQSHETAPEPRPQPSAKAVNRSPAAVRPFPAPPAAMTTYCRPSTA